MTAVMERHLFTGYRGSNATTKLSTQDVYDVLFDSGQPMTVKEIGLALHRDITMERTLKDLSNRCGYLVMTGHAIWVDKGTYQLKGSQEMTNTDTRFPGIVPADVPRADAPVVEQMFCDECGKPVASEMGLKSHKTRSHPKALTADEAFERSGQALEVLFPNGIPMSRIIELADLQKAMLRALK